MPLKAEWFRKRQVDLWETIEFRKITLKSAQVKMWFNLRTEHQASWENWDDVFKWVES